MTARGELPEAPFSELVPLAPLNVDRQPAAGPWSARLWDGAVRFLPVLLMAVLAALSWWLVKQTPSGDAQAVASAPRHDPDYTMRGFAISTYTPNGALRARLEGDVMHHFPDTDTVELDSVRLRAVDASGRVTTGSAQHAVSNGDATQIRLIGGARLMREPLANDADGRLEIAGEFLELFTETDRIRSHLPVDLTTSHSRMRANTVDYSHLDQAGQLGGRVTGQISPLKPSR